MTTTADDCRLSTMAPGARWKRHLANWKAYALAGGASLAVGTNADAQIVFSSIDQSITGNGASSKLSFAVNGHAVVAFQTHQRSLGGVSFGTAGIGARAGIKFYGSNGLAFNYARGAVIGRGLANLGIGVGLRSVQKGAGGSWTTHGNFGSVVGHHARAGTVAGYLGFRTDSGDKGWIKIRVGPSGETNAGVAITVDAYAYNSTPGGSINAGDMGTVPEPGTMALVLMAAGAAGLTSIRRARARIVTETAAEAEVVTR
jgi:hypothetical protein